MNMSVTQLAAAPPDQSQVLSEDGSTLKLLPPRLTRARNVTKPSRSVRNSARYSAVAFARSFSKARSMTRLRQRRIEHVRRAVRHKRERITGRAVLLAISFPQHSGFGIGRRCQDQRTTAPARGLSAWCALRQRRIEHLGRAVPRLREAEYLAEFRTDLEGFVTLRARVRRVER